VTLDALIRMNLSILCFLLKSVKCLIASYSTVLTSSPFVLGFYPIADMKYLTGVPS